MSVSQKITFPGTSGAQLAAVLQLPKVTQPRGYALFAHCFTCTKDIFAARQVARSLAELGIAVLRFDFTGLGESEGEFAATNFTSNVADLIAAAEYLASEYGGPQIMIGHSLGGAATLAAASHVPAARAVCTIGAPADPAHVEHLFTARSDEIRNAGQAEVLLAGRPFVIQRQFLEDISSASIAKKIANLGKALLICHAPDDSTVGVDNARKIYETAKHPKSFLSLDGADHLLSRHQDAEYVAQVIAVWAQRYLDTPQVEVASSDEEPDLVVVEEAGGTGLAQLIVNGKHELIADEPTALGGGNAGPTPYGLLLSALGSCTTMTLRLYANKKQWPLKKAKVLLRHTKIHAEDCAECEEESGFIETITRELELIGDLDEKQRARLLEISERCPVHRTLTKDLKVTTTLRPADQA